MRNGVQVQLHPLRSAPSIHVEFYLHASASFRLAFIQNIVDVLQICCNAAVSQCGQPDKCQLERFQNNK